MTCLRGNGIRRRPFLGRLPTKADWQYLLAQPYRELAVVLGVSPRQAQRYKHGHGSEVKMVELLEGMRRRGTLVVPVEAKVEEPDPRVGVVDEIPQPIA
ncbi:MAG: hypothetical protein J0M02_06705 [Planctomycetes bacterium]|nr:hypothetical protein [Planctomycetota bacterium]